MQRRSLGSVRIFYPRFNKEELIEAIRGKLAALGDRFPLLLVVLFGSYAKGRHTVASDVDVLVVYEGEKREGAFATVKRILDIPSLEPHVYSQAEYEEMRETVDRMVGNGVVLFPFGDA